MALSARRSLRLGWPIRERCHKNGIISRDYEPPNESKSARGMWSDISEACSQGQSAEADPLGDACKQRAALKLREG